MKIAAMATLVLALLFPYSAVVAQSTESPSPSTGTPQVRHVPPKEWQQCGFSTPETQLKVSPGKVTQGKLIHRVNPEYPAAARKARIQGTVVLCATIGKDGTLRNLRAASGPEELIPSAMEAVAQWRYKPFRLKKEPVDVDSEIHVGFALTR
jgi:TonB family protein